ncbi:hypothetical protein [Salinicola avicenniae]|uniref:hypothetical protein n=1 Tax=Salinicola avicenniae TaxID=2916836 RepID=UPI0020740BB7|nr:MULTISPECIES: hypothetical protein [unclassified Salinicola]
MKRPISSLLALAVAAASLSPLAQAGSNDSTHTPVVHGEPRVQANPLKDAVVASWSLDNDQLAALARSDSEFRAGLRQLHDSRDDASRESRRAAVESLLEQQRDQLLGTLSDAQLHAYQMLERPRPAMRRPHDGPDVADQPSREAWASHWQQRFEPLFASWHLSEQQSAEVRNAERTFFDGLHALKRPDRRAPDAEHDARSATVRQLIEQRQAALSEVLSDDQLTAYEALTRPPHHARGPHPRGDSPAAG